MAVSKPGMGNLRPMLTFDMVCIAMFVRKLEHKLCQNEAP